MAVICDMSCGRGRAEDCRPPPLCGAVISPPEHKTTRAPPRIGRNSVQRVNSDRSRIGTINAALYVLNLLKICLPRSQRLRCSRHPVRQLGVDGAGGGEGAGDVQSGQRGVEAGAQPGALRHHAGHARGRRGLPHCEGGDGGGRQARPPDHHGQEQGDDGGPARHRPVPDQAAGVQEHRRHQGRQGDVRSVQRGGGHTLGRQEAGGGGQEAAQDHPGPEQHRHQGREAAAAHLRAQRRGSGQVRQCTEMLFLEERNNLLTFHNL